VRHRSVAPPDRSAAHGPIGLGIRRDASPVVDAARLQPPAWAGPWWQHLPRELREPHRALAEGIGHAQPPAFGRFWQPRLFPAPLPSSRVRFCVCVDFPLSGNGQPLSPSGPFRVNGFLQPPRPTSARRVEPLEWPGAPPANSTPGDSGLSGPMAPGAVGPFEARDRVSGLPRPVRKSEPAPGGPEPRGPPACLKPRGPSPRPCMTRTFRAV